METLLRREQAEVCLLKTEKEIASLLTIFQQVADELSWQPGDYLHSIPNHSLHFAGLLDGTLTGGIQLVLQNEEGYLPCQKVWSELKFRPDEKLGHVTIMALAPEFRGCPGLFWSICVELSRYCVAQKINAIILECTPPMLKLYRRIGWPLRVIGELRKMYLSRRGLHPAKS